MTTPGRVYLVGAGPGDPELLTVKAASLIRQADVIVHDRLVAPEILALVPKAVRRVPVGKEPKRHPVPQARINELLIDLAHRGLGVVRLKGGDPLIFGRGSEEAAALRAAGVAVEIVPGITAAQGAAAVTGVPLTHRGLATGVRYVTGHCRDDGPLDFDWAGLADPQTTLVIYMGYANIARITDALLAHGLPGDTPALVLAAATTPRERRLVSQLDRLVAEAEAAAFSGPVLFIIGRVVSLHAKHPDVVLERLAISGTLYGDMASGNAMPETAVWYAGLHV